MNTFTDHFQNFKHDYTRQHSYLVVQYCRMRRSEGEKCQQKDWVGYSRLSSPTPRPMIKQKELLEQIWRVLNPQ